MAAETAVFAVRSAKPCFSWASCYFLFTLLANQSNRQGEARAVDRPARSTHSRAGLIKLEKQVWVFYGFCMVRKALGLMEMGPREATQGKLQGEVI